MIKCHSKERVTKMFGVAVNTITVLVGSIIGLIFKKGIPEKLTDAIMTGIGLCTVSIGISGLFGDVNTIILIASMVFGAAIGALIGIDSKINSLGEILSNKIKTNDNKSSVAGGFVTACLLFCVGSMTIVGSLNAGISGNNKMLLTKSLLDLISSMMLSASLGIGVLFSSVFVFVFQGLLVLLARYIAPILTADAIAQLNGVGSLIIFALGLNIIGITKIKVADYLPAIVIAPILSFAGTYIVKLIPFI